MKRLMIGVLVLLASAPLWGDELRLPPGKWWENQMVVERLQLTAEQQERIRSLVVDHARRMIDLTAEVKKAELDLKELADRNDFDPDAVRTAFARFQKTRQVLETDRFELLLQIRLVLTAQQWHELNRMRQEVRDRRSNRMRDRRPQNQMRRPR